jgi:hypothetical protein
VLYVWLAKPTLVSIILGEAFVISGLLLRALASGHVQKNEQLATSGPYAYTRNPLYLGSLILACGFAVASRSGWVVLGIVGLFFIIYLPVIRSEEAFLRQRAQFAASLNPIRQRHWRIFVDLISQASRIQRITWRCGDHISFSGQADLSAQMIAGA